MAVPVAEFLAAIEQMAAKLHPLPPSNTATEAFYRSMFFELYAAVKDVKRHLPPRQREALLRSWQEYIWEETVHMPPTKPVPDFLAAADFPERRFATLIETLRKLVTPI